MLLQKAVTLSFGGPGHMPLRTTMRFGETKRYISIINKYRCIDHATWLKHCEIMVKSFIEKLRLPQGKQQGAEDNSSYQAQTNFLIKSIIDCFFFSFLIICCFFLLNFHSFFFMFFSELLSLHEINHIM